MPHAPHLAVTADPWPGTVAVYASASDADYTLNRLVGARATMGITQTVLGAAPAGLIDRGEGLIVELAAGALSSVDDMALLNGANLAAIGDGTSANWELFQFRDAELVGENRYLLRHRLRGQLGSDARQPAAWPAGSYFVRLDGVPGQIEMNAAQRNLARHYRIGPARRSLDDPTYQHLVEAFAGIGLKPLSPCHLRVDTAPGGDLVFTWIRRTRIGGDSWEGLDVPLGEESEAYLVQVSQDGAVLREAQVTTPGWTYPAGAQASDGASGAIELRVAQISASFGAGEATVLPLTL